MKIDLTDRVAAPNLRPQDWQLGIPDASWTRKAEVGTSEDLRRIVALPRRPIPDGPLADALVEEMTSRYTKVNHQCICASLGRECITRLRVPQAWALYELSTADGLLGAIGVGHGKTLLDLLAPLAFRDCKTALLLVPPSLVKQLAFDYDLVGQHFKMPSLMIHGTVTATRTVPGAPVLHVMPYSRLSGRAATTFLETLAPDVVIADEVDMLRHRDAVRTARVMNYVANHAACRFAGWTGSMTDSSVNDYAHLSALALRDGSPLPIDATIVEDWARAIDPGENPAPAGSLLELCQPGEHIHSGFHRRLIETEGVVSTSEPSVDCALVITRREAPSVPEEVQDALTRLRRDKVRPDGEELLDALSVNACALELACGFYYRWRFPLVNGQPQQRATIEEWLDARKCWRREVRRALERREPHLDSPDLLARAAARHYGDRPNPDNLPTWEAVTWPRWRIARSTVVKETETVRLHPFLAQDAAEWAMTHRGVVWYQRTAFGVWVSELSGCRMHGGGPDAVRRILAEDGRQSIAASIKSHGRGRNGLQFRYRDQLVANPSSSATDWQQLLGRLHRQGQKAPEVRAEFYGHTEEFQAQLETAKRRANYVAATMGDSQKLTDGNNSHP